MIPMLALLLASFPSTGTTTANLARIADVEVQGPVRDLVLALGSAGEARLEGGLLEGERLHLSVPLPLGNSHVSVTPELRWTPGDPTEEEVGRRGRARFLGWRADLACEAIERLPPGLRSRSRPPISAPEVRVPLASLALLPALFVLGLGLRRRRAASILLSGVGSIAVLALGWPRAAREPTRVTILESDAQAAAGLALSATWERASISASDLELTCLEASKQDARIVWTGGISGSASGRWSVLARGSALYLLRPLDPGTAVFSADVNRRLALIETWVREEGSWTSRGPWTLGEPLPAPADRGRESAPPGWLVAGLPQGIPVLLGRAAASEGPGETVWIRQTGL